MEALINIENRLTARITDLEKSIALLEFLAALMALSFFIIPGAMLLSSLYRVPTPEDWMFFAYLLTGYAAFAVVFATVLGVKRNTLLAICRVTDQ